MELPPKKRCRRSSDPGIFESSTAPNLLPTVRVVSAPASDDGSSGSDSMKSGGNNVADNESLSIRLTVSKLLDAARELENAASGFSERTTPGPRATTDKKTCAGDIVAVPGPSKRAPPLPGAMEQRTVVTSKAGAESQDVSNAYETAAIVVNLEPHGPNSAFDTAARSVTLSPTGDLDMQQPPLGVMDTPPIPSTSGQVTPAAPAPSVTPPGTVAIDNDIAFRELPNTTLAHLEEQQQREYEVVFYEDSCEEEHVQNREHNEGRGAGGEGGSPVPVEDNSDEGGSPLPLEDNSDSSGEQESHSSDEDIRQTVRNIGF